jgi:DNA-binding response OmpR family regulator
VLIVENDSSSRTSYEELIKSNYSSFDVISARDGYDALNIIANRFPSIIIVNHDLPFMTGLQLLESIFKAHKNSKISVLVIMENISEEIIKLYNNIGINTILPKPISLKLLHKRVEEIINLIR